MTHDVGSNKKALKQIKHGWGLNVINFHCIYDIIWLDQHAIFFIKLMKKKNYIFKKGNK
jgi:hypothetical protein